MILILERSPQLQSKKGKRTGREEGEPGTLIVCRQEMSRRELGWKWTGTGPWHVLWTFIEMTVLLIDWMWASGQG